MAQQQLSQDQLLHFKTTLRERSDALRADIRNTLERSADETHVRMAEQARDVEDDSFSNLIVDLNFSEVERDVDELRRISSALRRANDGTYGLCEDCDVVIPTPRLEAEPTASRCIRCQELYEKTHAGTNAPTL
ncbi:MAG TPA: TraR/DksA family transcriptional regulator [Steroidobacteraceae bacterium]|nr:TraR/DksA family transcriptional regulator [Steroidobacteraceae bacterium]